MGSTDWRVLSESLTDANLLLRLKSNEHDFVERKPKGRNGDWLQAAVAFANSAPIGWPAVLFVGVDDNGSPQYRADEVERALQSVSGTLDRTYPAIYRHVVPLKIGDERACLAVVIPGSPNRPHFAGQAYVRVGDATKVASEEQFAKLIAHHSSKATAILDWVGKGITWINLRPIPDRGYSENRDRDTITVETCNPHFATFQHRSHDGAAGLRSYPLNRLELSFDHGAGRLTVYYYPDR